MSMMKRVCAGVLAMGLISAATLAAVSADRFEVDKVHSAVIYRINHLGTSYSYGRFNDISGTFTFNEQDAGKSEILIEVKTGSVDSGDKKRDDHLKSPDFFNVKQFPVMSFASKTVKKAETNIYDVTGDLTLHGVTKSITTKVEHVGTGKDPWGGTRSGFETVFTVKRSDFGINFMPDGLGDEVRVTVSIEGVKK